MGSVFHEKGQLWIRIARVKTRPEFDCGIDLNEKSECNIPGWELLKGLLNLSKALSSRILKF
jgi:hypothetical protein